MRFPARALVCFAFALCSVSSFGAKEKPQPDEAQAVILDHSEYPCQNCLFGMSDYFVCFNVNNKILVGRERVRTQTRQKAPDNLLEKRGQTVPIHYDGRYIWAPGPKGKDIRMEQDYSHQVFLFNDQCKHAVQIPGY